VVLPDRIAVPSSRAKLPVRIKAFTEDLWHSGGIALSADSIRKRQKIKEWEKKCEDQRVGAIVPDRKGQIEGERPEPSKKPTEFLNFELRTGKEPPHILSGIAFSDVPDVTWLDALPFLPPCHGSQMWKLWYGRERHQEDTTGSQKPIKAADD
jgi:hypothetical protein